MTTTPRLTYAVPWTSSELPLFSHIASRRISGYTGAEQKPLFHGNAMATAPQLTTTLPSAQEWKDVLEEILPPQGEWSEDEYLVLTDHRNRLVEFTDGFLEVLPMPTDKHQAILGFLFLAFLGFMEPRGGKVHFRPVTAANSAGQVS